MFFFFYQSKKQRPRATVTKHNYPPSKNRTPKLGIDLGLIVKKQKNGEDPIPLLTDLISKYDGLDKSKIIAQLCSYSILFSNNLRFGVEEFIKLIEIPGISNNYIITVNIFKYYITSYILLLLLVLSKYNIVT